MDGLLLKSGSWTARAEDSELKWTAYANVIPPQRRAEIGDNLLRSQEIHGRKSDLDFVATDLDFVARGLDFVAPGLDFVVPGFDFLVRILVLLRTDLQARVLRP